MDYNVSYFLLSFSISCYPLFKYLPTLTSVKHWYSYYHARGSDSDRIAGLEAGADDQNHLTLMSF